MKIATKVWGDEHASFCSTHKEHWLSLCKCSSLVCIGHCSGLNPENHEIMTRLARAHLSDCSLTRLTVSSTIPCTSTSELSFLMSSCSTISIDSLSMVLRVLV